MKAVTWFKMVTSDLNINSIKCQSTIIYLCFLDHYFTNDPRQHDLFSLGQLLGGLSGRSFEAVRDHGHDHEDVAEAKQDPDDQA